ncbi:hypothetical protein L7F22_058917 [Adiantum nelumboides]|nr:hypothetical protein [Adiantum nelumboides]
MRRKVTVRYRWGSSSRALIRSPSPSNSDSGPDAAPADLCPEDYNPGRGAGGGEKVEKTDADAHPGSPAHLEELCLKEFGFHLSELRERLRLLSEELQSSLDAFCAHVLCTNEPVRWCILAKGIVRISQHSVDQSISTLAKIQSTSFDHMQKANDLLSHELFCCRDEVKRWRDALDSSEADASERLEQEKAVLQGSLRACQICEVNPRNVVILPCFHGQYCAGCLEGHQKINNTCPTCRGAIKGTLPYFA